MMSGQARPQILRFSSVLFRFPMLVFLQLCQELIDAFIHKVLSLSSQFSCKQMEVEDF